MKHPETVAVDSQGESQIMRRYERRSDLWVPAPTGAGRHPPFFRVPQRAVGQDASSGDGGDGRVRQRCAANRGRRHREEHHGRQSEACAAMTSALARLRDLPEAFTFAGFCKLTRFSNKAAAVCLTRWKQRGLVEAAGERARLYFNKLKCNEVDGSLRIARCSSNIRALCSAENLCCTRRDGLRRSRPDFQSPSSRARVTSRCMGSTFTDARFPGSRKSTPPWIPLLTSVSMVCGRCRHRSRWRICTLIPKDGTRTRTI